MRTASSTSTPHRTRTQAVSLRCAETPSIGCTRHGVWTIVGISRGNERRRATPASGAGRDALPMVGRGVDREVRRKRLGRMSGELRRSRKATGVNGRSGPANRLNTPGAGTLAFPVYDPGIGVRRYGWRGSSYRIRRGCPRWAPLASQPLVVARTGQKIPDRSPGTRVRRLEDRPPPRPPNRPPASVRLGTARLWRPGYSGPVQHRWRGALLPLQRKWVCEGQRGDVLFDGALESPTHRVRDPWAGWCDQSKWLHASRWPCVPVSNARLIWFALGSTPAIDGTGRPWARGTSSGHPHPWVTKSRRQPHPSERGSANAEDRVSSDEG
jgi:hypothetical protein